MGDFASIAAIVLLVLLGPWVLVWRVNSRRKRERAEDQERWRELTSRTYALEQAVLALQAQRSSRSGPTAEEATPKTSESPFVARHFPHQLLFHRRLHRPPSTTCRAQPLGTSRREMGDPNDNRTCDAIFLHHRSIDSACSYASHTTASAEFRHHGVCAVADRPVQIITRPRRDAGHELAEQAGHRHLGARCRVLSWPTNSRRSVPREKFSWDS